MAQTRLAIVTPRFWPLVGNAPTHLLRLAESLLDAGQRVTVVTARWKRAWPEQMAVGPVPLVRLRGAPRGGWSTLRWMYKLSRWLRQSADQFDALLVSSLRQEAFVALGARGTADKPVVILADEGDIAWQQSAAFGSRIAARAREASSIVAPSPQLAEQLIAGGYKGESITVIPRRVPIPPPRTPKRRDDARTALAAANYDLVTTSGAAVALAIGRLHAEHRFGDLVRAWRIVAARRSDARLWIVGDGPEREPLYRQISDLDQRFRVLIPGTFDCLEDLFQASDMFLVPGQHTVPPLAMLEAMAAGLPVIATDSKPLAEYVLPDQTGLQYPAGDIKALAAAVLRLIENPAAAVTFGSAAREHAQRSPTPEAEAAEYAALLNRLTH